MSITNYGELKTAVAEWLAKSNLSSRAADFITLASTRIYYGSEHPIFGSEPIRCFELQTSEAPTASSGFITLPTRYLATIRLQASNGSQAWSLDYLSPAAMSAYEHETGYPGYYTFLNGQIRVSGTTTVTWRHDYFQELAAMSADSDTNALLTKAPGLWLYAASLEAAIYQKNDTDAGRFHALYMGASGAVNRQMKEAGGGTLVMKAR